MYINIKNLLWIIISVSVSILLLPTLIGIFGLHNEIIQFIMANGDDIYAVIVLSSSILSGILILLISDREKKAKATLAMALKKDAIWDIDSLTYHTRMIFYKVHNAWNNNDPTGLQDYFTLEFLEWFKEILANKTEDAQQDKNLIFNITGTNIICCQDFLNNDKDKFVGYIQGNLIEAGDPEETADDGTFTDNNGGTWKFSTNGGETGDKEFSEVYHFCRSQDDWLLNKIDFRISIWNLLSETNKFEQ